MPSALITGITGQDGSYLTELLLGKGYTVHGVVRRASQYNRGRIEHLRADPGIYGQSLFLHYADLTDTTTLRRLLNRIQPDELYHLAGQSHVGLSFEMPESTCLETANATLGLLEICRDLDQPPRIYHATSSEMFGAPVEAPQTERTPFRPVNPYGCAKVFAANLCRVYRDVHQLFICNGIAYNHESPRRGENFVTRKITSTVHRIRNGSGEVLRLGNLESRRDWGYAPEYVDAMWRLLQEDKARDYVLATGKATRVRDFAEAAFTAAGISVVWEGEGAGTRAMNNETGKTVLEVDPGFYRPMESTNLVGDPTQARNLLGWEAKTAGTELAKVMLAAEK